MQRNKEFGLFTKPSKFKKGKDAAKSSGIPAALNAIRLKMATRRLPLPLENLISGAAEAWKLFKRINRDNGQPAAPSPKKYREKFGVSGC